MKKTLLTCILALCAGVLSFGQTTFATKVTIDANTGDNPYTIASGDIDGDGPIDILIGLDVSNIMVWYKNNGNNTYTKQSNITNTLNYIGNIKMIDIDGVNGPDIVATGYSNNTVAWYPNDGSGNFSTEHIISSTVSGASGIAVGEIDGDSTLDIAVTAYLGNSVVWFAQDGIDTDQFSNANAFPGSITAPGSVQFRDITSPADGKMDAIVATAVGSGSVDTIEIYRNNGTGTFTQDLTPVTTGKNYIFNASFEDLDGDANLDILATELDVSPGNGNFYWIEEDGIGGYTETTMITTNMNNPSVAQVHDLDDDGDDDIVLSSGASGLDPSTWDLVWYINDGSGDGNFIGVNNTLIDNTQSQAYVFTVNDFDGLGDLDIVSNAFNEDDLNFFDNEMFSLGVSDLSIDQISVYPNPTSEKLNIKGDINQSLNVRIYNILGNEIMNEEIDPSSKTIDVSQLQSGVYIMKLDEYNTTFKIIKQ